MKNNNRIETKYIVLDEKLLKVQGDNLYFNNKQIHVDEPAANGGTGLFKSAPISSNSSGTPGDIAFDSLYFYICIKTNTWIRTALASW
jgi:hypothetical protein